MGEIFLSGREYKDVQVIYGPLGAQEEGPKGHRAVNSFSPAPEAVQSSNFYFAKTVIQHVHVHVAEE